jgi:hypothetical protein
MVFRKLSVIYFLFAKPQHGFLLSSNPRLSCMQLRGGLLVKQPSNLPVLGRMRLNIGHGWIGAIGLPLLLRTLGACIRFPGSSDQSPTLVVDPGLSIDLVGV